MSIKRMSAVWEYSQHAYSALLQLLAIADSARDNGYAFPGINYLAKKARISERQAIRINEVLAKSGELFIDRGRRSNRYVVMVWPPGGMDVPICESCGIPGYPEFDNPLQKVWRIAKSEGGVDEPWNVDLLCRLCTWKRNGVVIGDKMSPVNMSPIKALQARFMTSDPQQVTSDPEQVTSTAVEPYLNGLTNDKEQILQPQSSWWEQTKLALLADVPPVNPLFQRVEALMPGEFEDGTLSLIAPTEDDRAWCEDRLAATIQRLLIGPANQEITVNFVWEEK